MTNMRVARKAAGYTMKQLGEIVGVSESTISLYERGMHEPDFVTVGRIADALHTTVDYILGREQQEKPADGGHNGGDLPVMYEDLRQLSPAERQRVRDFVSGILSTHEQ